MDAAEVRVDRILEGSKQFFVPHFQRPYAWRAPQWQTLWDDVVERIGANDTTAHFIGPIVTGPGKSVPEGVEKRVLIDGQQRLTTIIVLLTAIRDQAKRLDATRTAERIQDLITNRHEDGLDKFKVLPTQGESADESDRDALISLVDGTPTTSKSAVLDARRYFDRRLQSKDGPAPDVMFDALTRRVTLVSIKLGDNDDPYRIFESLNGKGRPLSQADLIRNFFFMRLPRGEHDRVYAELWRPMQKRVGEEQLTDFIRHDLTASTGTVIRETDVYATLKTRVDRDADPLPSLRRLADLSCHYEVLQRPGTAKSAKVEQRLQRLRRLEITVAYPLLLHAYAAYGDQRLSESDLLRLLDIVETYVLRRFVCGVATYGLNKIFAPAFSLSLPVDEGFVGRVGDLLARKECPSDAGFRPALQTARLYGAGERREKLKLILERLEQQSGHKESVDAGTLTIEHVMPQTLTDAWRAELGSDHEEVHDDLLHTLGNLTLTGYNAELGNLPFVEKRARYLDSHLELNRWFASTTQWNKAAIEGRAVALSETALRCWPWFGSQAPVEVSATETVEEQDDDGTDPTGTVPSEIEIRGTRGSVRSWAEVARAVANYIVELGDEVFDRVSNDQPKFMNRDATAFRRSSKLSRLANGAYLEQNLSARAIYRWSARALDAAGVGRDEWSVTTSDDDGDGPESEEEGLSELRIRQQDFWTQALVRFGQLKSFPSLPLAPSRHWLGLAVGRGSMRMNLLVSFREQRVTVKLLFRERAFDALQQLTEQRAAIEAEVGSAIEWNPHPDKATRSVRLRRASDLETPAGRAEAIEWLGTTGSAFYRAFTSRLQSMEF